MATRALVAVVAVGCVLALGVAREARAQSVGAQGSPMDRARACFARGDDTCVVRELEGHATTEAELGLLAITYRQLGNRPAAERTMRRYISRFANGLYAARFGASLAEHP